MTPADASSAARAQTVRHQPWTEASDFAIGLRPIALQDWFEGGEADVAQRKLHVTRTAPEQAWGAVQGSHAAQLEALGLVGAATGLAVAQAPHDPLLAAATLVSDDLCLMEKRAGEWTLTAASLCAPTFFSAADVVGKPLSALHAPVPGFADRLLGRVTRIFDNLRPDVIVERRNWTVLNSAELFLPDSTPVRARLPDLTAAEVGEALHVRVERQTLRRLPQTGAVLFTIRVWRWPLDALAEDPTRLAAFAQAWRSAPPAFRAYKRLELYDALVEGYFEERAVR